MTTVDNKNFVIRIAKHADAAAICQVLRKSISAVCALDYGNDKTAKEFYLKQGFVANGVPNKVANYLGEFPLRKNLTVSEKPVSSSEG